MSDNKVVKILKSVKEDYVIPIDGLGEAVDMAVEAIKAKNRFMAEIDKAIEKEKEALDQFADDFNHHLWVMRGLQVAKKIMEGESYEQF